MSSKVSKQPKPGLKGAPPSYAPPALVTVPPAHRALRATITVARPQSIVGPGDERQKAPTTNTPPWSRICRVYAEDGGGRSIFGSGWIAGPSTVFTAAHCLVDGRHGFAATRAIVWPGREDAQAMAVWESAQLLTHPRWTGAAPEEFDIGAIHLPQGAADALGWMQFAPVEPLRLQGRAVRCSGYPDAAGHRQFFGDGSVQGVGVRTLRYSADTTTGQSGSPVYADGGDGVPIVIGVHVTGDAAGNTGVRIDDELFALLMAWRR